MQICGICGNKHCALNCDVVQIVSHIPDKIIPSKAKLTLPEGLELKKMVDNTYNVVTKYPIVKGTQFGPLQAKNLCSLLPTINFPLRVFNDKDSEFKEYYLDTTDENECNWMIFISPASDFQEQNVVCYQDNEDIYYVTVKDILEGEDLKVWYSPYYASKMKKDVLKPSINKENFVPKSPDFIDVLVKKKRNITRETWSCKFCGKMERNVSEFALHLLTHYRNKFGRYCQICNVSFIKIQGYKKHMKIIHEKNVIPTSESKINVRNKEDDVNYIGGPLLLNEVLNDSMDNSLVLTQLEDQSNLFEQDNLNLNMESILPDSDLNFELIDNDNEQFICDICLSVFRKLKYLIQHMSVHTGKFACFKCNKVFARRENLNYHPCNVFYKFQCTVCNKLFYQKKYLLKHIRNIHTKLKSSIKDRNEVYKCTECSKCFTFKNNLITHLKIHQGDREKYTCPVCFKILGSYKTYTKHYKLHNGEVFKCEICNKSFKRKDTLKEHINLVHSPKEETCPVCNKTIKSKKLLKLHLKTHEDTVYKCAQCPSKFKTNYNLKRHVKKLHESNKSIQSFLSNIDKHYSCPKCDKKVKFSKSLKLHIKNAHPEENIDYKSMKFKGGLKEIDEAAVIDLKQSIENMNFDEGINREITIEIDKLLSNPENFGSDSNDRLVESLINNAVNELDNHKDSLLSMPDLDIDSIH